MGVNPRGVTPYVSWSLSCVQGAINDRVNLHILNHWRWCSRAPIEDHLPPIQWDLGQLLILGWLYLLSLYNCHGVTPREAIMESSVDQTPYLAMAVTPEQRSTYVRGAGIFEKMWSGQGCRRGGDRRGVGG